MEDILKFNRIQGRIQAITKSEKITASALHSAFLTLGTDAGAVHTIFFNDRVVRPHHLHSRQINCLSVDKTGTTIASCSDNGSVVLYDPTIDDSKDMVINFNEPLKAICIDSDTTIKKDRSFIVGCSSGQLIFHRTAWFSQKNIVLFNGAGSAVSTISWTGSFVAWSDATHVRLMDISTQSAICYVDCPIGVSVQFPFPCQLFWENPTNLWISWADSVRHLELRVTEPRGGTGSSNNNSNSNTGSGGGNTSREIVVRTVHDWQTDCIVCGLSAFDNEHLMLLGYLPPEEESDDEEEMMISNNASNGNSSPMKGNTNTERDFGKEKVKYRNHPELQIVRRSNGKLVSADVLPMKGELVMSGPWGFKLHTSYLSVEDDKHRWQMAELASSQSTSNTASASASSPRAGKRGGNEESGGSFRGPPPVAYIIAPQDLVVARVRDVNDRVSIALAAGDLQLAANLATGDSQNLWLYKAHELVSLYIDELLDREEPQLAASECSRLIRYDALQWERWILNFASRNYLHFIAPFIPSSDPRLQTSIYEVVIENFLHNDSKSLFDVVCRWGKIIPPLFDRADLLLQLESHGRDIDEWALETRAKLYLLSNQYEKAIDCYLMIKNPRTLFPHEDPDVDPYRHVFELIDKMNLHDLVKDRIVSLVRLSKPLAALFLVRSIDKLTVAMVTRQLRSDRQMLHWYLNLLFRELPETYNTAEYADFHIMQVTLYAEFAPKFVRPVKEPRLTNSTSGSGGGSGGSALDAEGKSAKYREAKPESDFLYFLRTSNHAPLDFALKECDKRRPPLYPEMIYILARVEKQKEALIILLKEIGDVEQAVNFVETHDQNLWSDLVEYSLKNYEFLTELLDYVGICSLDPNQLVSKIPRNTKIEGLKQKLINIISQYKFQVFLNDKSNSILDNDALTLLRQLNQSHRRATRVEPNMRCAVCDRPLFMSAANNNNGSNANSVTSAKDARQLGVDGKVWGNQTIAMSSGAAVIFNNKTALHKVCLDSIRQTNE